ALARTKATFEDFAATTTAARDAHSVLNCWLEESSKAIADNKVRLAASLAQGTELARWDPQSMTRARSAEAGAAQTVQDLTAQLGAAQELKRNLSLQLNEISGGLCPFLRNNADSSIPTRSRRTSATSRGRSKR